MKGSISKTEKFYPCVFFCFLFLVGEGCLWILSVCVFLGDGMLFIFYFVLKKFIYLVLTVLDLRCCTGFL